MLSIKRTLGLTSVAALLAASLSFTASAHNHSSDGYDKDGNDIISIAKGDERFSTLVAALQAADMEYALDKDGSYTVFAPTNDAFDALPEGTLESLLEDTDQLRSILTYHIIGEKISSSDVPSEETQVETLNGGSVRVMASYGTVMVDTATVVIADIEASNGVIHAIDSVIIPAE
ncbi:MAG: fasciclin domain-containing protein [Idiomarina sp.]|nr:fasciclin domain-containing protein [Idiomarina sp.]